MKIRTVIVDDEPSGRSRIVRLLEAYEEIQLIGQCRNGYDAVELINRKQPQLIFLDIQMPDLNGFQVLSKLDLQFDPMIIFATAYDQYALKAFDVHAIDYLLKPFDKDRFQQAIFRAKEQIQLKKSSDFNRKLTNLLADLKEDQLTFKQKFSIKKSGYLQTISVDDVVWIESEGNYVILHLAEKQVLYRSTMNDLQLELDPQHFLRIHRSILFNIRYLKDFKYLNNNEYRFTLKNGQQLLSSRSYKASIVETLSDQSLL